MPVPSIPDVHGPPSASEGASTNPASHSPPRPSLPHRFRWDSEGPTWELAAAILLGILVLVASLSGGLLLATGPCVVTAGQLGDAIGGHLNVVLSIVNIFVLFQIFRSQKQDARRELRVAEESALLPRLLELATIAGGMSTRRLELEAKANEWRSRAETNRRRLSTERDMHHDELPQWIKSAEEQAGRLESEAGCLQIQIESINATVNAAIDRLHPQGSQAFLDLWDLYEIKRNSLVPGFGVGVATGPGKA